MPTEFERKRAEALAEIARHLWTGDLKDFETAMKMLCCLNEHEKKNNYTLSIVNGVFYTGSSWAINPSESHFSKAWWTIGICYLHGIGVEVLPEKADSYFEYVISMFGKTDWYSKMMGEMEGTHLEMCIARSLISALVARIRGSPLRLGRAYLYGKGAFPRFYERAYTCFKFGISEGCLKSQVELGVMYIEGNGVQRCEDHGYNLLLEAAYNECEYARKVLRNYP